MSTNFPTSLETRPSLPTGVKMPRASEAAIAELLPLLEWLIDSTVALEAKVGIDSSAVTTSLDYKSSTAQRTRTWTSPVINIDNGAGATIDHVFRPPNGAAYTIRRIEAIETTENAGTVNAATVSIGQTVGGTDILAATGLTNSATVGARQALRTNTFAVASGGATFIRHTGIAATVAGEYQVQIEYTLD